MIRVLIADDSEFMRVSMREILEEAGYVVAGEASTGKGAVEAFRALGPDVVMLDMRMRDGGGIESLRQISSEVNGAVVIAMTAVGKPDAVLEALRNGASGYLTKPFDRESVVQAIAKALSMGRKEAE